MCSQIVDIVLLQSVCQGGWCCYLAHIEIRMARAYASKIAMIEEITISHHQTLRWFGQYVNVRFFVSNHKVRSTRCLKGSVATATSLDSTVVFM